jgi:hypothetical protein
MAYNVSTLADYTQQNEKTLLVKAVLSPKTIARIKAKGNVMTGVKSKSQLPQMDTDAVFQNGAGCGFNASGSTSISAREVEVGKIKVQEALCPASLEDKFTQLALTSGSNYDEAAFAADYTDLKIKKIANALEVAVWQGDKASGNAQLNRFDGFIKVIDTAVGVIDADNTGVTEITEANVISVLKKVRKALPAAIRVKEDAAIFVGQEVLDMYLDALSAANLYHYKADEQPVDEAVLHGTKTKIYATAGLTDTNRIFATHLGNMFYATDLLSEEDSYELFHAKEADEVRFSVKWKSGVQIAFPSEVVSFDVAAA